MSGRHLFAAGAVLLFAGPAAADLYRWVDAEGRVAYGDRPPASATQVERRGDLREDNPPAAAVAPGPARARIEPAAEAAEVRARVRDRLAALDEAQTGLVQAQRDLERARQARDAGAEPLPGERLGMKGGGSRLGPAYFERQQRLEEDVRRAQARLDAAAAAKNALR